MLRRIGLLVALMLAGCAGQAVQDESVPADEVPPPVASAANKLYPGLRYGRVWRFEQDGETVYEFRGKTPDGKSHEATISESGKVLWPIRKR